MSDEQRKHWDLMSAPEAVVYLRLDLACGTPDAARRRLNDFASAGRLAFVAWGRTRLYSKTALDAFVADELHKALEAPPAGLTDSASLGNQPLRVREAG